jgi:hypothetical protein
MERLQGRDGLQDGMGWDGRGSVGWGQDDHGGGDGPVWKGYAFCLRVEEGCIFRVNWSWSSQSLFSCGGKGAVDRLGEVAWLESYLVKETAGTEFVHVMKSYATTWGCSRLRGENTGLAGSNSAALCK